ncbi:phosphatidylinositol-4- kinase, partial [Coemansia nantahalensis]
SSLIEPGSATARSMLATGVFVMCRTLYAAALASLLTGDLDQSLLAGIFEHIGSEHALRLSVLTSACLRVLSAIAVFFPASRAAVIGAVSRFVTAPPAALVAELPLAGQVAASEEALMLPAAAALASCMRPLATERARAVSTIHALFNDLAVPRTPGSAGPACAAAPPSAQVLRASRSTIVVLSQLALLLRDQEITRLVVGMICAPRFISAPPLVVPAVQRAAKVAAIAGREVLVEIVSAALKHISFGSDADVAANANTSATLTELAWQVAGQAGVIEGFLCAALRSFVDASIDLPAQPRPKRGATTPLSVYLPILRALVQADGYAMDREATAEQTLLWRSFWFHLAVRGFLTEKAYVAEYGATYSTLAAKSPILVHPTSVNYLDTEIEYSSVLQREYSEAGLVRLRLALGPVAPPQSQVLLRNIGFSQAAFLLAVYRVELARAAGGNCSAVLRYFSNAAVATSAMLPAVESIAGLVIAEYVRELTSHKWSIEDSLAATRPAAHGGPGPSISAQVRELMVASCHHLELVSRWAQRFVDRILAAFPQALLERAVVSTLLELVQLVWKSCKAEQDDQFVPVYLFSSRALDITLQLPDSITYRKTLFAQFSACARRWLGLAARAAPMEMEALLQVCFAAPCDDDLSSEPHVGRALALEVGNAIRYGPGLPVDVGHQADALPPNSSPFTYRLGRREFLRGRIGRGADVGALKQALSDIYAQAKERPGQPLPGDSGAAARAAVDAMSEAAHCVVVAPHVDREL